MKGSTKNRVRGKIRQVKGKAKRLIGLEADGLDDQVAGTVQNVAGKLQKKLED